MVVKVRAVVGGGGGGGRMAVVVVGLTERVEFTDGTGGVEKVTVLVPDWMADPASVPVELGTTAEVSEGGMLVAAVGGLLVAGPLFVAAGGEALVAGPVGAIGEASVGASVAASGAESCGAGAAVTVARRARTGRRAKERILTMTR